LAASELAIDEHTALMNGCRRAMFEGNFLGPWKQLSQELGIDHDNSPDLEWFTSIRLRADRAGSSPSHCRYSLVRQVSKLALNTPAVSASLAGKDEVGCS